MTRYDTRAQYLASRERRWIGALGGILLLGFAGYFVAEYAYLVATSDHPVTTFYIVLALFVGFLSLVPFSIAFLRRMHPTVVEVLPEGLRLDYPGGKEVGLPWASPPVDYAWDTREAPASQQWPPGLEVQLWITLPGRYPESTPFRPQELFLSGKAFDEIRVRMAKAGYRPVSQPWRKRRPGTLVQFVPPGKEAAQPPPMPYRRW
jgi:hypothetical protein